MGRGVDLVRGDVARRVVLVDLDRDLLALPVADIPAASLLIELPKQRLPGIHLARRVCKTTDSGRHEPVDGFLVVESILPPAPRPAVPGNRLRVVRPDDPARPHAARRAKRMIGPVRRRPGRRRFGRWRDGWSRFGSRPENDRIEVHVAVGFDLQRQHMPARRKRHGCCVG